MRRFRFFLAFPCLAALALASGACSEPVPLIPQGAWFVSFQTLAGTCSIQNFNNGVGAIDGGKVEYVTQGSDGAEVECEVSPSGGAFFVSGSARFGGQFLEITVDELPADATLDSPATGTVAFATSQTASNVYRSSGCRVYFGEGQSIDDGTVVGSFQCDEIDGSNGDTCAVRQGYFAFDKCAGAPTEEE